MPATTPSTSQRWRASVERAEEEGVEHGEGARAHREDVAQDAADAGRRALVGLDRRRVVVALDAQRHGDPVAGVDDPGVLARADEDLRAGRGQAPKVDPRRLVRAVLAPHDPVEGELQGVRVAPEDPADPVELVVGEPESPVQWLGGAHAPTITAASAGRGALRGAATRRATRVGSIGPGGRGRTPRTVGNDGALSTWARVGRRRRVRGAVARGALRARGGRGDAEVGVGARCHPVGLAARPASR